MGKFYKSVCTPSIFEVRDDDGTVWVRHRYGWSKLDNNGAALGWWLPITAAEAADYGKENVSTETPKEPEWPRYWIRYSPIGCVDRLYRANSINCGGFEWLPDENKWSTPFGEPSLLSFINDNKDTWKPITPTQAEAIMRDEKEIVYGGTKVCDSCGTIHKYDEPCPPLRHIPEAWGETLGKEGDEKCRASKTQDPCPASEVTKEARFACLANLLREVADEIDKID